jgi:hypothetical protein
VAWVVLEELVMSAEDGPRAVEVATTVRELAGVIGLSKDAIASGLRRLIQHGLATREDQRDRRSGCFGNSVYRVNLSQTGLRPSSPDGPKPAPESSVTATAGRKGRSQTGADAAAARLERRGDRSTEGAAHVPSAQMSLLDAVAPCAADRAVHR